MKDKTGIQKAIDKFGGSPSRLAAAVGAGVLRQHVEHWLKVGRVSAERCPDVYAATGVSCADLNDRVNWSLISNCVGSPPAATATQAPEAINSEAKEAPHA